MTREIGSAIDTWAEFLTRDNDACYKAAGNEHKAHYQSRSRQESAGVTYSIRPLDQGHHRDPGFESRKTKGEPWKAHDGKKQDAGKPGDLKAAKRHLRRKYSRSPIG